MNALGIRRPSYGEHDLSRPMVSPPPTKVLLDGYKESFETSIEERPRYNPLNKSRPRSSALLNINDPVVMHLLMETAMADSQEYEVLSYEEIEDMKKEFSLLNSRIEATKRKLAVESKVREAAQSLHRLYSAKKRKDDDSNSDISISSPKRSSRRVSLLGHRRDASNPLQQSDDEYLLSTKKCEELAQELWKLEGRAQDLQLRILQHTAGILQMTHKGIIQNDEGNFALPTSPESMARDSVPTIDSIDDFDDRSLYQPFQFLDSSIDGKSTAVYTKAIQDTEKKLEELSSRMHKTIIQNLPDYRIDPPPQTSEDAQAPEANLPVHLGYLEKAVSAIDKNLTLTVEQAEQQSIDVERRLEDLNHHLHEIISQHEPGPTPTIQPPPRATGQDVPEQLNYMQSSLDRVEQDLERLSAGSGKSEKAEEYETTLAGLWDIIGPDNPSSPLSPTATPAPVFSLQAFSAHVQSMFSRYSDLMEQKQILTRQIQQQRELNSKSDAEKDVQFTELTEQLDAMRMQIKQKTQKLESVMDELDTVRAEMEQSQAGQKNEEELSTRLKEKEDEILKIKDELAEARDDAGIYKVEIGTKINDLEMKLHQTSAELQTAQNERQRLTTELEAKTTESKEATEEVQKLESEVIRLQTELTVARAELDGAYGTRAQRAAEVAANPAVQKEIDDLNVKNNTLLKEINELKFHLDESQEHCKKLERELSGTLEEFETLTSNAIQSEREHEALETQFDELREKCEKVEAELSEERVKWLGAKNSGQAGGAPAQPAPSFEMMSVMVLKNEFKKMMKETRAENMKALKYEQEERRKAEATLRALRKEHTPHASLARVHLQRSRTGLSNTVSAQ